MKLRFQKVGHVLTSRIVINFLRSDHAQRYSAVFAVCGFGYYFRFLKTTAVAKIKCVGGWSRDGVTYDKEEVCLQHCQVS
jgi:hypothetical protein